MGSSDIPIVIDSVWPDYDSIDSKIRKELEDTDATEDPRPYSDILDYDL